MKNVLYVGFFPLSFKRKGELWVCGNITLRKKDIFTGGEEWTADIDDGWKRDFTARTPERALVKLRHYLMVVNKYCENSNEEKDVKLLISNLKSQNSDVPLKEGQFRLLPILERMNIPDFMYEWVFMHGQSSFQDLWSVAQVMEEIVKNDDSDEVDYRYHHGKMFFEWLIEELKRRGVVNPSMVTEGKAPFQTTGFCIKRLEKSLYNYAADRSWLAPKVNVEESYE